MNAHAQYPSTDYRDALWIGGALFVVSVAIRLWYQNAGLFLFDSVVIAEAVERSFESGTLQGQINGRHGSVLANLALYVPWRLLTGGTSAEQTVLWTNILCGALAVPAFFGLTSRLMGDRLVAAIAAASFSLSPVYLSVTTYGKPHGLEVLTLCGALYFVLRARDSGRLRDLVFASTIQGFAILCREAALILLPLFFLLYFSPRIQRGWPWLRFAEGSLAPRRLAALLLPLALIGLVAWVTFLGDVVFQTFFAPNSKTVGFKSPFEIRSSGIRAGYDLLTDLAYVGLPLAVTGFALCVRNCKRRDAAVFLLVWAAALIFVGNASGYWPRMLAPLTPPWFALSGVALAALIRRVPWLGWGATLGFCTLLFVQIQPVIAFRSEVSGEKAQALWLAERVPSDALILVVDDWVFVEYYTGLETRVHPGARASLDEQRAFVQSLVEEANAGRPIYALDSAFWYDLRKRFRRALRARFELTTVDNAEFEDYHQSALKLNVLTSRLIKLSVRAKDR